jgi:hypothetical protein
MVLEVDKRLSVLAESTARRLTRRRALTAGVKGGFAAVIGVALGQGLGLHSAEAWGTCTCNWAKGIRCSGCPYGAGCPSGWTVCKLGDPPVDYRNYGCNGWCNYEYGQWTPCGGLGTGYGYRVCTDCKTSSCAVCTCLSQCINCNVSRAA